MSLNLATCNGNERIQRNPEGDFGDTAGAETRLWNCMHKQKSEAKQLCLISDDYGGALTAQLLADCCKVSFCRLTLTVAQHSVQCQLQLTHAF